MLPLLGSRPESWIKGFFPTFVITIQFLFSLTYSALLLLIPIIPPTYTPCRSRTPRPINYSSRCITLVDSIVRARFEIIQYLNYQERRVRYIIVVYIDRYSEYIRRSIAYNNVATREGLLPIPLPFLYYLLTSIVAYILDRVTKYKEREIQLEEELSILYSEIRSYQEEIRAIQAAIQQLICRTNIIRSYLARTYQLRHSARIQGLEILQRSIEALDRKDLEVSSITLEDTTSPERSIKSPSTNNNTTSPSSPANVSIDPEFACLLQEASNQFIIDQAILDPLDTIFQ